MEGGELHGNSLKPVDSPRVVQVSSSQAWLVEQAGLEEVTLYRAVQVVVPGEEVGGARVQRCGK